MHNLTIKSISWIICIVLLSACTKPSSSDESESSSSDTTATPQATATPHSSNDTNNNNNNNDNHNNDSNNSPSYTPPVYNDDDDDDGWVSPIVFPTITPTPNGDSAPTAIPGPTWEPVGSVTPTPIAGNPTNTPIPGATNTPIVHFTPTPYATATNTPTPQATTPIFYTPYPTPSGTPVIGFSTLHLLTADSSSSSAKMIMLDSSGNIETSTNIEIPEYADLSSYPTDAELLADGSLVVLNSGIPAFLSTLSGTDNNWSFLEFSSFNEAVSGAIAANGEKIFTASSKNEIFALSPKTQTVIVKKIANPIIDLAHHRNRIYVLLGSESSNRVIVYSESLIKLRKIKLETKVQAITFEGDKLIGASKTGEIIRFSKKGKIKKIIQSSLNNIVDIDASRRQRYIVTSLDGNIAIIDNSGTQILSLPSNQSLPIFATFAEIPE